jgi:hypothetical protein
MANLYGDFASAIRNKVEGHDAPGVPGIDVGLRGMAFIEAAITNHRGDAKWTALVCHP